MFLQAPNFASSRNCTLKCGEELTTENT